MKRLLFFLLVCLVLLRVPLITGCANIVPPTGGPRDSVSPGTAQRQSPDECRCTVDGKKIILNFDEYMDMKDIRNNLIVSPVPKIAPTGNIPSENITVELKDTLQPNTTYSLNFGQAITDVNENNVLKNFTYTFSTGSYLDSCPV